MGFGFEMTVTGTNKLTGEPVELLLRPYEPGEESCMLPGMRRYSVNQFINNRFGRTLASEAEHIAKLAADDSVTAWAICLIDGDNSRPIGTTEYRRDAHRPIANSGSIIYDPALWGMGYGSLAHLARTYYGFHVDGIMAIRSGAASNNRRSLGALASVGYRPVGTVYHVGVTRGKVVSVTELLLVNPEPRLWNYFWGDTDIPSEFHQARQLTAAALQRAASQVTLL